MRICHLLSQCSQTVRLLQITDTHLFADPYRSLLGVNTAASYQAVVDEIQRKNVVFDAIIATGDLSQDHSTASYQRFAEGISNWSQPCYWLPGNHDCQPKMRTVFEQPTLVGCDQVLMGEYWQLIILDSQVKGLPHGRLTVEQLTMLEIALISHPKRYGLVLMHHHPLAAGSSWLDQHQLNNQDAFWSSVEKYDNVKGVVCGHIHQALDIHHEGRRVMAAPSTCIQFLPDSSNFALDSTNPGWREILLHQDGKISSEIGRLKGKVFCPDMHSTGY
ncbi:3',5'-cyclic-AMP phosphodiesterase [Candidatus Enterovibrio escicola]|uniref:3',5'-cyclic adenosine monophosphate phosphodiesterase CpdA n=1 Tax=Candidatus Enterovibrio escicola TaxID=1927127 RepID=A0A2A5T6N1_9GAMM|nr:3',5'-cyclic-AMP phosphodiesterase [Candidatus Enterovibrio escacola]PCS23760.1 3',5'-cyclic-nucleotide phosphodiesterase [Candidatus Enterovibrio escacola]